MSVYRNEGKARQGIRVGGKVVWVEPGAEFNGKPDRDLPDTFKPHGVKEKVVEAVKAVVAPEPENTDALDDLTDEQLRELIEPTPHHRTSRAKLLQLAREQ